MASKKDIKDFLNDDNEKGILGFFEAIFEPLMFLFIVLCLVWWIMYS